MTWRDKVTAVPTAEYMRAYREEKGEDTPAPLKALVRSLWQAREPELIARLQTAIAGVKRLYASPERLKRKNEHIGDMKRRRVTLEVAKRVVTDDA